MKCIIILEDEINVKLQNIRPRDLKLIIKSTELFVKGANQTSAFKIGIWNGKESQVSDDGSTFLFMLPFVLPILEELKYDFELKDNRPKIKCFPEKIDKTFLSKYGIDLRPYQVKAVNLITEQLKGLIEIATSGGKTLICAALAKLYDDEYRTIVIVPKDNLVTQTFKDFKAIGLETGKVSGRVKDKEEQWNKRHVITTWQTLNRNRNHLHNFDVVLYDEAHIMGDTMYDALKNDLKHAPIRVGFSGSIPKDRQKRQKIACHIGADVIYKVSAKELQDEGYISTLDIDIIPVKHAIELPMVDGKLEWDDEFKYLTRNVNRIATIADYISTLDSTNTLILTHPQFGKRLSEILNLDFIDKDVSPKVREEIYKKFDDDNYACIASFETVGTGISINNIQRVILIDVGKNLTRILQSIGRGLRLDDKRNHTKILDLYAVLVRENKTKYSFSHLRHLRERKKIYNENHYPFKILKELVVTE